MKIQSISLFWVLGLLTVSCSVKAQQPQTAEQTAEAQQVVEAADKATGPFTIAMCGDIMMGTTFPTVQLPANRGRDLFQDTKEIFQSADMAVGNLEGTILDGGTSRKSPGPNSYSFRTPTDFAPLLSEAGFDFLSMANNHARDFGDGGIISTEKELDKLGIKYSGIQGRTSMAVVEKDGVKYGFCAFGHNSYTIKHLDLSAVKAILDSLNNVADIIVVSFHGGAEGRTKAHLPYGEEFFLGENRGSLREFTHFCIDNGADVVYGHGPHVVRCVELYKDRFIAYSLGNFCTPYGMNLTGISGQAPIIEAQIAADGKFLSGKIHSFIQQRGVGPRKDATHSVAKQIRDLTLADIKDNKLLIADDGTMTVK